MAKDAVLPDREMTDTGYLCKKYNIPKYIFDVMERDELSLADAEDDNAGWVHDVPTLSLIFDGELSTGSYLAFTLEAEYGDGVDVAKNLILSMDDKFYYGISGEFEDCGYTDSEMDEACDIMQVVYGDLLEAYKRADSEKSVIKPARRCTCGCGTFIGRQVQRWDVYVDIDGTDIPNYLDDVECYDAETPYGPFTCTNCGKEYGDIEDIPLIADGAEADSKSIKTHRE